MQNLMRSKGYVFIQEVLEVQYNILLDLKENEDFNEDKTILFSPATSSFCQFKNFEHRGNVFKELTVKIFED